jgi:hypothetical protein
VYDSSSGSGVALVPQGQNTAGRGRGCVETGSLEQVELFGFVYQVILGFNSFTAFE